MRVMININLYKDQCTIYKYSKENGVIYANIDRLMHNIMIDSSASKVTKIRRNIN